MRFRLFLVALVMGSAAAAQPVVPLTARQGNVRLTVSSTSSIHLVVDQVATIVQP